MPREISPPPPLRNDAAKTLREMADRARRLAWGADALTGTRLGEFAAELEAKGAALETAP